MMRLRKILNLFICIAITFSICLDSISVFAEVTIKPGEAWNTYLSRVYQERYDEYLQMQQENKDNYVPLEEVWTGNEVQPTEDADGDGLLDVYTAAQFRWALVHKASMELMNDIDLGGRNKVNWTPVADPGDVTIEGNGHTVYNLYISRNGQYTGLISATGNISGNRNANSKFLMQNIRFRYAYVYSGGQQYTGCVIGFMGQGKLFQVSVEDSVVHGGPHTGGIFTAWSSTTGIEASSTETTQFRTKVDQCHVRNVTVYGTSCVGSFAGPLSGTKVTNSYSIDSYDISTSTHSGGFVSCPGWCWIENCFTNVRLYCNSDGGVFAGICHLGNTFKNCFAAGVVEGTANVGGFFGRAEADLDSFTNCYSTSMVGMQNTASYMGGFYGSNTSGSSLRITNCYAAGEVGTTQTVSKPGKNSSIAGFGGWDNTAGVFVNSYYDKQTSGMREYAIGNTLHNNVNGITGYLTGQMIGDAMKDEFGEDDWVYTDAMYPQLAVFANPDASFGNATDREIAKAYSAASVCTALLQPSNLDKTQAELAEFSTTDYDTVRDITVLFPLTNNELAGYDHNSELNISWATRDGYTCQVAGDMYGMNVITIDKKTYETLNFTPGVGWVDVNVDTGIVNPQNGENIVGQRFMRLVPTTVISVGDAKSNSGVVYVPNDSRLEEHDTIYDHRKNVSFAVGEANDVDSGNIKNSGYPINDTTFGYEVDEEGNVKVVGVDLPSELGGKIVVVVSKLNEETGKYERRDIATDKDLQDLLLERRQPTDDDLGIYRLEYRWFTSGNLNGGYITNSKTLTVRYALNLSYEWNHPDHAEDSLIMDDDYPYVIGQTVNDVKHQLPESPKTRGYTFYGWSTNPKANPDNFVRFTENTGLEDNTVVYAIWKINSYDVNAVKTGRGFISGTGKYDFLDTAKVTWGPEDDWYVNYVMVDGVIRDDLLTKNQIVFEDIEEDHTVYVEFTQDPQETKNEYYQVTTSKSGGDETCTISDSISARSSTDVSIAWSAGEEYEIKKVLIDGIVTDVDQANNYVFSGISRNHHVEVVFEKKAPVNEFHVSESYSSINTNKVGDGTISSGSSLQNGQSYTVTWNPNSGSHVAKVLVDGVECTDESILNAKKIVFNSVSEDHTVEVIFEKNTETPEVPGTTIETYKIDTMITGGPGTITPGSTVEVEKTETSSTSVSYTVNWTVPDQRYKIQGIYVDGTTVDANSQIVFNNIEEDHSVAVVLEPNLFEVKTVVEGSGTVTPGATLFWGDNYTVNYQADEGWRLYQIYEDGNPLVDYPEPEVALFSADFEMSTFSLLSLDDEEMTDDEMISLLNDEAEIQDGIMLLANEDELAENIGPIDFNGINADHTVHVVFVRVDEDPNENPDETINHKVDTSLSGGLGTITPGAVLADGSAYTINWNVNEGYEVESVEVKVNGISKEGLVNGNQVILEDLGDDIEVNVKLRPTKTVYVDGTNPSNDVPVYNIYTNIEKGAGTISSSLLGVEEGSTQTVNWTFANNSTIRTIYVDGVVRDDLLTAGQLSFENITADHTVEIFVKESPNGALDVVDRDTYHVLTSISGEGSISDSSSVNKGETAHISWQPADGYEVSKVFIDGVERENLKDKSGIDFDKIGANHSVHVEFKKIGASEDDPSNTEQRYEIATSMEGNGTISPSSVVNKGDSKIVQWEAKEGSYVATVIIDGIVRDDLSNENKVIFSQITEDHSVSVLFKDKNKEDGAQDKDSENHVFIKTSSIGQGTLSPSAGLKEGESYTVSWEPKEGWKVAGVIVDGLNADSLAKMDHITFSNATKSHTVLVIFVPTEGREPNPSHKIETDIEGGKGTITGTGEAEDGESYTVTWVPDDGYEIDMIIVDGIERPDLIVLGHWTIDHVDGEHTIRVIMRKKPSVDVPVVNTGDESNVTLLIILMIFSSSLMMGIMLSKKRRNA